MLAKIFQIKVICFFTITIYILYISSPKDNTLNVQTCFKCLCLVWWRCPKHTKQITHESSPLAHVFLKHATRKLRLENILGQLTKLTLSFVKEFQNVKTITRLHNRSAKTWKASLATSNISYTILSDYLGKLERKHRQSMDK